MVHTPELTAVGDTRILMVVHLIQEQMVVGAIKMQMAVAHIREKMVAGAIGIPMEAVLTQRQTGHLNTMIPMMTIATAITVVAPEAVRSLEHFLA